MLFRETVAVYCENHTEHTNTLCGQNAETFLFFLTSHTQYTGYSIMVVGGEGTILAF
jgi:hypothetical protein